MLGVAAAFGRLALVAFGCARGAVSARALALLVELPALIPLHLELARALLPVVELARERDAPVIKAAAVAQVVRVGELEPVALGEHA